MNRLTAILAAAILFGCASHALPSTPSRAPAGAHRHTTLGAVQHVVVIEMENRSFDHLFGTYPGANGIPANPTCSYDPKTSQCVYPYHDTATVNYGGPHSDQAERVDLDGGKLDGFVIAAETLNPNRPDPNPDEVMGYHTCAEVPVYCGYAAQGVLADNFFAATSSWSTMAHLYMVSGWSAKCPGANQPMLCVSNNDVNINSTPRPDFAWTDLTSLLYANGISWGYYVYDSNHPLFKQDGDDELPGPGRDTYSSPGLWNPLPLFDTVKQDGQIGNIQPGKNFDAAALAGALPAVSWIIPADNESDHPAADLKRGQVFVSTIVSEIQKSPDWPSTVIFIQWDEWGGFYDHVVPPIVDGLGYGFRAPMIMLSPLLLAPGTVDHQLLSSDAELKFIEDEFLGSARLDPNTDGRPDSRPDVRENYAGLGDLKSDLLP